MKAFEEKAAQELQQIKTNYEKQSAKLIEQPKLSPTTSEIVSAIIEKFLTNSTCTTEEEKAYLLSLLGNKRLVTTLLLRGSIHGWTFKDFHSRCDHKRPTISLFKVKDGDCIGGYTNA